MHPTIQVAQLVHILKRIEGRKRLQKIVHILQELGAPFIQPFEYSLYGMYSQQLTSEMRHLVTDELVTESLENCDGSKAYVFSTTSELDQILQELEADKDPIWGATARHLNDLMPQSLEGISTILFLRRRGYSGQRLRNHLIALKPRLERMVNECMNLADALRPIQ
jgi:uncharacterized protein